MNYVFKTMSMLTALAMVAVLGTGIVVAQDDPAPANEELMEETMSTVIGPRVMLRVLEELDMSPGELREFLQDSIIEFAEENGVDVAGLQAEMEAELLEQIQTRLATAVERGWISQEQADELLSDIESGDGPQRLMRFMMGRTLGRSGGFGQGHGFGMFGHGRGFGQGQRFGMFGHGRGFGQGQGFGMFGHGQGFGQGQGFDMFGLGRGFGRGNGFGMFGPGRGFGGFGFGPDAEVAPDADAQDTGSLASPQGSTV